MKKNFWILLLFIVIGLLTGALVSRWLAPVPGLAFLTQTSKVVWSPAADFLVFSYDFTLRIDLSLLSIIGLILAIWLYRKM
ncbi:hypothetical protein Back11_05930 [Paenibacillus baekrokdamisoli]|uniref:Uncharacterized protein n=1 Tax=Paenibacillus baekrokdamisoli TaxID=1712516 RepID=A0A3G9J668_9BACL|nr:DUF4321 domain-containing protein [Paenibacillus baekrokdamisoli]MBB3067567.1 hypothetical protein [Paenibacillus baekrokdamisoli]BBH19248.1 hypothetical protein Back11_05930 [Paenibacillus baekrokdamisoli]